MRQHKRNSQAVRMAWNAARMVAKIDLIPDEEPLNWNYSCPVCYAQHLREWPMHMQRHRRKRAELWTNLVNSFAKFKVDLDTFYVAYLTLFEVNPHEAGQMLIGYLVGDP